MKINCLSIHWSTVFVNNLNKGHVTQHYQQGNGEVFNFKRTCWELRSDTLPWKWAVWYVFVSLWIRLNYICVAFLSIISIWDESGSSLCACNCSTAFYTLYTIRVHGICKLCQLCQLHWTLVLFFSTSKPRSL